MEVVVLPHTSARYVCAHFATLVLTEACPVCLLYCINRSACHGLRCYTINRPVLAGVDQASPAPFSVVCITYVLRRAILRTQTPGHRRANRLPSFDGMLSDLYAPAHIRTGTRLASNHRTVRAEFFRLFACKHALARSPLTPPPLNSQPP